MEAENPKGKQEQMIVDSSDADSKTLAVLAFLALFFIPLLLINQWILAGLLAIGAAIYMSTNPLSGGDPRQSEILEIMKREAH